MQFIECFFFINEMHLCYFTNVFAIEAYHFKANVQAVLISRIATVPMFSQNHEISTARTLALK